MPPLYFVAAFAVSLTGAVIQAVCGFGYGPMNMSLLPYLFPYAQAVALSGLCGATTSVFVAVGSFKYINWRIVLPSALAAALSAALSVQISAGAADRFMVHSLGTALIALGIYSLFFNNRIRIRGTICNGVIAGVLAGILSGFFAVGGPPAALYMLAATNSNEEYRASLNAQFCITACATTFMRWRNGAFTAATIHAYGLLLVSLLLGTWIGGKIFRRLNPKRLRLIVYGYLIISGILMFSK